jgi:hypothetical protein
MDHCEEGQASGAADVGRRGYSVVYRDNEINHCPACGRTHWYIGRVSAQCGFCETALPLIAATSRGIGVLRQPSRREGAFEAQLA